MPSLDETCELPLPPGDYCMHVDSHEPERFTVHAGQTSVVQLRARR